MPRQLWHEIGYDHEAYCLTCEWGPGNHTSDLPMAEVAAQVLEHRRDTGHAAALRVIRVYTPHGGDYGPPPEGGMTADE